MQEPSSQDHNLLIGSIATVLHGNGQRTEETMRTVGRLAGRLGVDMLLLPGWG